MVLPFALSTAGLRRALRHSVVGQTVVASATFLDNVEPFLVVGYHIAIVSRMIFLTEYALLLSLLTLIVSVLLLGRF